ncbi:GFA family protein [Rhizobium beringeri]
MPIFHAKCTCGALALEVDGDPVHNHVCTCTRCQRASGGALAHNVWFREENVRIVSGEYSVWYPQGETTPDVMKAFARSAVGAGFRNPEHTFPAPSSSPAAHSPIRPFPRRIMFIGGTIARIGLTWPNRSSVLPEIELSWHRLHHRLSGRSKSPARSSRSSEFRAAANRRHIGGIISNFGTAGSTRSQARPRTE